MLRADRRSGRVETTLLRLPVTSPRSPIDAASGHRVNVGSVTEEEGMSGKTPSELRDHVRGEVVVPGDPDYEDARLVHNGMIDPRRGGAGGERRRCHGDGEVRT